MENVWKVGSRWSESGEANKSILGIFRRNNIVIVGTETKRFMNEVKCGDYFAIADGFKVVAVAKALEKPHKLDLIKLKVSSTESEYFDSPDYAVCVKVKIVDLEKKEMLTYKKRSTFCSANQIWQKVRDLYENSLNRFKICTKVCSLLGHKEYKALLDFKTKFIIPIYQRPYSWTENEIGPFMDDIINGYLVARQDNKNPEPMFIGTMQLSQKKIVEENEFWQDVVDGQQRITTLSILLKELKRIYPKNPQLQELQFDWLETHIHDNSQKDLETYFLNECKDITDDNPNPYKRNAAIIRNYLENLYDEQHNLDNQFGDNFVKYILDNIIFVVVETRAGLSKIIKIFNTINTTGLDLNGGDLFKIRMYEYMTDKQNFGEDAFESISKVYDLIDEENKKNGSQYWIGDILSIYQKILIGKYDLSNSLFDFSWETFFEKLFDTLLGVKTDWSNFGSIIEKGVTLDLEDLKRIIKVFAVKYKNDIDIKNKGKYKSADHMFAYKIMRWTRYSKYASIEYLYLLNHYEDKQCYEHFYNLLVPISKLLFVYSINYAKAVNTMHNFMKGIMKGIVNNQADNEIIARIYEKLLKSKDSVEKDLGKSIFENNKWKGLICRLSEFLRMKEIGWEIKNMQQWLFPNDGVDIEHIHALADETQWENVLLNSIGNLTMLEGKINRSISNNSFKEKKIRYRESHYATIQYLVSNFDDWTENEANKRKEEEIKKMCNWLLE